MRFLLCRLFFNTFWTRGSMRESSIGPRPPIASGGSHTGAAITGLWQPTFLESPADGSPTSRGANTTGWSLSELQDDAALTDEALVAAAAILGAEDALQIVLGLCAWSKGRWQGTRKQRRTRTM